MLRRRSSEDVELNVASMLDMAFQLLTFFILTFRPPALEGQISMNLPPSQPVTPGGEGQPPGSQPRTPAEIKGLQTLVISVTAKSGMIDAIAVGGERMATLAALHARLGELFQAQGSPFEQVVLQVSRDLNYGEAMRVVEVCSRQKLADGQRLGRLSFVGM